MTQNTQIQINDWNRWLSKKGPKQMKGYLKRVFKHKYINVFWYDSTLENFLINNNIEHEVIFDAEEERYPKLKIVK